MDEPNSEEAKIIMFRNRLAKVFRHLQKQARRLGLACYRIYDHDLPEFPLCIEYYGENLYVAEYRRRHGMTESAHEEWLEKSLGVIKEITGVEGNHIFLKLRQRKPGRLGQYQKSGDEKVEFVVSENGLEFIVNLSDYLDTGLFLDHRLTRQLIREESEGKKVLNLFAYTGSFSVYAAAGGAKEVVSVDLSATYLEWARRNLLLNGFRDEVRFALVQADVLTYLDDIPAGYYDIIILDPPTFSNSKRMKDFLDVQRDHARLINQCLDGLQPGGTLYFSTNYRKFVLDAAAIAGQVKDITKSTIPFDFEGKLARFCFRINK